MYVVNTQIPDWTVGDLYMINYGGAIYGWTVQFTFSMPMSNLGAWGALMTMPDAHTMVATNRPDNALIDARTVTTFGWSAKPRTLETPVNVTVNSRPCPVVTRIMR